MKIRLKDALDMVRTIEAALVPVGYHVGIRGSVLMRGESENDLDLVVYPHDSTQQDPNMRKLALESIGMTRTRTVAESWIHWRANGSNDEKRIEIWHWKGIVVDVLLVK